MVTRVYFTNGQTGAVLALLFLVSLSSVQGRRLSLIEFPVNGLPVNGSYFLNPDIVPEEPWLQVDSYPKTGREFAPDQVHLALWDKDAMLVSWATGEGRVGPSGSPPRAYYPDSVASIVMYGTSPNKLTQFVVGNKGNVPSKRVVYSYEYDPASGSIDGQGSVYQSPIMHHVVIKNLVPGQQYYYKVGSLLHGFSDVLHFKMPNDNYPISVGVSADWSVTVGTQDMVKRMVKFPLDLILLPGDVCYADKWLGNGTYKSKAFKKTANYFTSYQPYWDTFARMNQPLMSKIPTLLVGGNHEFESLVLRNNLSHLSFNARYPMPRDKNVVNTDPNNIQQYWDQTPLPGYTQWYPTDVSNKAVTNNTYFSTDMGPVHLVALSTYAPPGENAEMYKWFVNDMESLDRSKTKWIIVMFHAPFYSTLVEHYKEVLEFQQYFEPLFLKYKVDFVFNGHAHGYDRSTPVYNFKPNSCGPVYVTIGSGGTDLDSEYVDQLGADNPKPAAFCSDISQWDPAQYQANYQAGPYLTDNALPFCYASQAPWSDFRDLTYGFGILKVLNETHAEWKFNRNQDAADVFVDNVILAKQSGSDCNDKVLEGVNPAVHAGASGIPEQAPAPK